MAVYGLKKVTDQIISEAEAEAKAILDDAERQCEAIRDEWDQKTVDMHENLMSRTDREGDQIIARAKSTTAMNRRSILLQKQAEMLDETFIRAEREIRSLPDDQYARLLAGLLVSAIKEQTENANRNATLFGEADVTSEYEVILSPDDKDKYGQDIIDLALSSIGKPDKPVRISDRTAATQGGLILKYGDVETNCTLPVLMKQLREELEPEISRKLFK